MFVVCSSQMGAGVATAPMAKIAVFHRKEVVAERLLKTAFVDPETIDTHFEQRLVSICDLRLGGRRVPNGAPNLLLLIMQDGECYLLRSQVSTLAQSVLWI